jgi:hypothetical protein
MTNPSDHGAPDDPNDVPELVPPHQLPPIRSQADLARLWRMIRGPQGFDEPQLWMEVLGPDDRCQGVLLQVAELPPAPDGLALGNLFSVLHEGLGEGLAHCSVAFLYARPGGGPVGAEDTAWARALLEAAAAAEVRCRPVHFGNDEGVRVFAPDDLGQGAA